MTYPGPTPNDDETRQFRPLGGLARDSAGQGDASRPGYDRNGYPYPESYREPPVAGEYPEETGQPRTRNARFSEMYDLSGLVTESVIVSVLWGVLFGVTTWVVDLLAARASDAGDGDYTVLGNPAAYTIYGILAAAALAVGFALTTGLTLWVNDAEQVWRWAVGVVPLGCVIILLTGGSLWNTAPSAVLLVIAAIPLWTLAPIRVSNYRNADVPRRIVER